MCEKNAASSCEFGQDSCAPLETSNWAMLVNACVCALFSLLLLGDTRCTAKQILRGLAPFHAMAGFLLILMSTLVAVFMFAGREFAGATEVQLYWIVEVSLNGVWTIAAVVCVCGHFRWRSQREAKQERRTSSVGLESNDEGVQLGQLGVLL